MKGLIHIYTGTGKGKTTAAVGLGIRCAGNGGKVLFSQFLKDNKSSELNILKKTEHIHVELCGETFGFYFRMTEETKQRAGETYGDYLARILEAARKEEYRLLILDEIIAAYNYELVDRKVLLEFLATKPEHLEVVLTGRDPAEELLELADYVSEIVKIKHPYDKGIPARDGIEM
ncbi:MAG TPA: cob(I)yrinic acid a,c-diamide adenosyltransferase [Clostridiales bacterium]|nr:cob(I)yrinic acid a,c-diamide adenosyltransferase [Clostridiales bacterium]